MCVLLGYGADAICPYLVFEMAKSLREEGVLDGSFTDKIVFEVRSCYYVLLSFQFSFFYKRVIIFFTELRGSDG